LSSSSDDGYDDEDSSNSQRLDEIKRFDQDDLCVIDDLSDDQFETLVLQRIIKIHEVHSGKFHARRRNSIEVLEQEVKESRLHTTRLIREHEDSIEVITLKNSNLGRKSQKLKSQESTR